MSDNTYIGTGLLTRFEEKEFGEGKRVCSFSILPTHIILSFCCNKKRGGPIPPPTYCLVKMRYWPIQLSFHLLHEYNPRQQLHD